MIKLKRPESLTEIATTAIREAIINNDFILGQPLSESILAKSMEISKTPVREALAKLKSEGLVIVVPQSGTYVFTMTLDDVIELLEYRYVLEVAALKSAFNKNLELLIKEIDGISNNMNLSLQNQDIRKYIRLDFSFHQAFFTFCGNKYLSEAYDLISAKIRSLQTRIAIKDSDRSSSFKEHMDIWNSFKKRDVDEVLIELNEHFERTIRSYKACKDELEVFNPKANSVG
jgi:DNA-binding GntR family transcriptional regulator